MKLIKVERAEGLENPHGVDAKRLYSDERMVLIHIAMKAGEEMKRHSAEGRAFFYVLEGRGVVEIGGESSEAGSDTLIECPPKVPHRWINTGETPLKFLVIKYV